MKAKLAVIFLVLVGCHDQPKAKVYRCTADANGATTCTPDENVTVTPGWWCNKDGDRDHDTECYQSRELCEKRHSVGCETWR